MIAHGRSHNDTASARAALSSLADIPFARAVGLTELMRIWCLEHPKQEFELDLLDNAVEATSVLLAYSKSAIGEQLQFDALRYYQIERQLGGGLSATDLNVMLQHDLHRKWTEPELTELTRDISTELLNQKPSPSSNVQMVDDASFCAALCLFARTKCLELTSLTAKVAEQLADQMANTTSLIRLRAVQLSIQLSVNSLRKLAVPPRAGGKRRTKSKTPKLLGSLQHGQQKFEGYLQSLLTSLYPALPNSAQLEVTNSFIATMSASMLRSVEACVLWSLRQQAAWKPADSDALVDTSPLLLLVRCSSAFGKRVLGRLPHRLPRVVEVISIPHMQLSAALTAVLRALFFVTSCG